jgi:hypothetical protein
MKIKKILCSILACAMIVSLCACGTDTEDDTTTNPSSSIVATEDSSTEATEEGSTEDGTTDVTEPTEDSSTDGDSDKDSENTDLQSYYEGYFSSEDFGFVGNSVSIKTDKGTIEVLQAEDKSGKVMISNGENLFEIYKTVDNKQLAHVILPNEETGENEEVWYQCKVDETSEEDVYDSMSSESGFDTYNTKLSNIKDIKYLRTENGIDYVSAVQETVNDDDDIFADEDAKTITYEIEFEKDGQKYSFTQTVTTSENGTASVTMNENVPEDFNVTDYKLDFDKKVMTHNDTNETIPFTILSETEDTGVSTSDLEIGIDAKTHKVVSISGVENGLDTVVTFLSTDTIKIEAPVDFKECDEETLAGLYLVALFSFFAE